MYRCLTALSLLILLLPASCGRRDGAALPEAADRDSFDSWEYCYNGCAVVSEGGRFGIADSSGMVLLPLEYDAVSFVTDDVALASAGDDHLLVSKGGDVIARSADREYLIENCEAIVRSSEAQLFRQWDAILDDFEHLCNAALSGGDTAPMLEKLADIKEKAADARGRMTPQQKSRFEALVRNYNTLNR